MLPSELVERMFDELLDCLFDCQACLWEPSTVDLQPLQAGDSSLSPYKGGRAIHSSCIQSRRVPALLPCVSNCDFLCCPRSIFSYKGNYDVFVKTAAERLRNAVKAAEAQAAKRAHVQVRGRYTQPLAVGTVLHTTYSVCQRLVKAEYLCGWGGG
jgi:hypothetical protein